MRTILSTSLGILLAVAATMPAQAQLADQMSRGKVPNALDRAAAQPLPDNRTQAELDQLRSDQAARDAQTRLGPIPGSTLTDGPAGVQGTGSVSGAPSAPPTPPQS